MKPVDISSGECNIIALCYFFTQILNNLDEKDAYKNNYLLIIDDPISSFDLENKVGIQSYLRSQIKKILVGNKESKVVLLSHDLNAIYDFNKAAKEFKKTKITHYVTWELQNKSMQKFDMQSRHEYTTLIEMIYKYATGEDTENELIIGNVMRRVLEAFSTFEYKQGFAELSFNEKVLASLKTKINNMKTILKI